MLSDFEIQSVCLEVVKSLLLNLQKLFVLFGLLLNELDHLILLVFSVGPHRLQELLVVNVGFIQIRFGMLDFILLNSRKPFQLIYQSNVILAENFNSTCLSHQLYKI